MCVWFFFLLPKLWQSTQEILLLMMDYTPSLLLNSSLCFHLTHRTTDAFHSTFLNTPLNQWMPQNYIGCTTTKKSAQNAKQLFFCHFSLFTWHNRNLTGSYASINQRKFINCCHLEERKTAQKEYNLKRTFFLYCLDPWPINIHCVTLTLFLPFKKTKILTVHSHCWM